MPTEHHDIPPDDLPGGRRLTPRQAFAVLGLPPDAGRDQVRTRYRRLAFLHHPDRNHASADSFRRFRRISHAYHTLRTWLDACDAGETHGECACCRRPGPTRRGLDGRARCRDCLASAWGRRFLPSPPVVVAGCGFAIAALTAGVVSLLMFLATSRVVYGTWALVCGLAALVFLAGLALIVVHVDRPTRHPHRARQTPLRRLWRPGARACKNPR